MRIYDHCYTKSADFDADELHNDTITLADLSEQKIWVAWKEQLNKQGKLTKIPKIPAIGDNAKVPSDPSTYGTLDDAITCSEATRGKGGIGIVLGPIDNERHLVGIDLNSCRDLNTETIADWAAEVINRSDTYAEISPSQTGIKLFFQSAMAICRICTLCLDVIRKATRNRQDLSGGRTSRSRNGYRAVLCGDGQAAPGQS